ncbi:protein of unknown function [Hyphomicrobium sp. MC1]|nr:protein of unknown function [Hyphomicrobium sp. MC1]
MRDARSQNLTIFHGTKILTGHLSYFVYQSKAYLDRPGRTLRMRRLPVFENALLNLVAELSSAAVS